MAETVDLDVEDDGSYAWAVFRQEFGGVSRSIARRLVGSQFEPAAPVDTGAGEAPRIDMNGRGIGAAVSQGRGSSQVDATVLEEDAFKAPFRIDGVYSAAPPTPVVATTEREGSMVSWRHDNGGGNAVVRVRMRDRRAPWGPEGDISTLALGPVVAGSLHTASTRIGDYATAWLQGTPAGGFRVMVGGFDRPPGTPIGHTTGNFQNRRKPRLKWQPGLDLWGKQTFKVFLDDQEVGQTAGNQFTMPQEVEDGPHTWYVVAVDRRGQENRMRRRNLRVDTTPPFVRVRVTGTRRRGSALRVAVTAEDDDSGLKTISIDYGDRTPKSTFRTTIHRYRRSGRFILKVIAKDRAGNRGETRVTLRIRK